MKFDNVSFSKEGYEKFKTLTKEKQIKSLAEILNPKDEARAEVLLKNIPNNDSTANDKQASVDNGERASEQDAGTDNDRSRNKAGKNTGVKKG